MVAILITGTALILQTRIAWLAWRIGKLISFFRLLAIAFTLMAIRRGTATLSLVKQALNDRTVTELGEWDRATLPMLITVILYLFTTKLLKSVHP